MRDRRRLLEWFILAMLVLVSHQTYAEPVKPVTHHDNDAWLIGKWVLSFDPEGDKKDYLEFKADGDAFSYGPLGEVEGLYLVNDESVKAVFTYQEKDFIMTFFYNMKKDELRIVTSHTGRESIYKKVGR